MPRNPAPGSKRRAEAQAVIRGLPVDESVADDPAPAADPEPEPKPKPIENTSVAVAEPAGPKAAPPKKKPATPTPSDLLTEEIGRERRLAESREELFFRRHHLLQEGGELTAGEFRLLKTAVPHSAGQHDAIWKKLFRSYLGREENRVQTVISLQATAGTPNDRSISDGLSAKTAGDRDQQAPNLQEEIRERQAKLQSLRQAATSAQAAADDRHQAVENLRDKKLLPQFVLDELAAACQRHTRDFAHGLVELEVRRGQLEGLLALDLGSPEGLQIVKHQAEGNARFGDDAISRLKSVFDFSTEQRLGGVAHRFGNLRPGVWQDYLTELREELATVEVRIEEIINGDQVAADKEIKLLKSYYVPS